MNGQKSVNHNTTLLKVGDRVVYRSFLGLMPEKEGTVARIEIVNPGEKYGYPVKYVDWVMVELGLVVVVMDNGKLAYGKHISPLMRANSTRLAKVTA